MMYGGKRRPVRAQHVWARDRPLVAYSTAGAAIGVGVRAIRLQRLGVPRRAECTSVPLYPTFSVTAAGPACVCARAPCQLQFAHICGWLAFLGFLPWAVLARPIGGRRAEQSAPLYPTCVVVGVTCPPGGCVSSERNKPGPVDLLECRN